MADLRHVAEAVNRERRWFVERRSLVPKLPETATAPGQHIAMRRDGPCSGRVAILHITKCSMCTAAVHNRLEERAKNSPECMWPAATDATRVPASERSRRGVGSWLCQKRQPLRRASFQSAVSRYETGVSGPSLSRLAAMPDRSPVENCNSESQQGSPAMPLAQPAIGGGAPGEDLPGRRRRHRVLGARRHADHASACIG